MDKWAKRKFDVYLPVGTDRDFPAIVVLHGGGSNKEGAEKMTCPDGDLSSPFCLSKYGTSRGFAVVYPNGTGRPLIPNVRTWNAGGGANGYACISGYACRKGIDDTQYFRDLFSSLKNKVRVSSNKIFLTGGSNGASMSYRLACELPNEVAGIAPVSGNNQFGVVQGCSGAVAIPTLHIHGTADPCWPYKGGRQTCVFGETRNFLGVNDNLTVRKANNACADTFATLLLPDNDPNDGTQSYKISFGGCAAPLVHIQVEGGGHTWPGGYNSSNRAGAMSRDFSASEKIVTFFEAQLN